MSHNSPNLVVLQAELQRHLDAPQMFPFHRGLGGIANNLKKEQGNLHLLPQDEGDHSPACLDGSPYGFYFVPSKTNSTAWTISIEGGGWCYNETLCFERSKTNLGSSKGWAPSAGCGCMNTKNGELDSDCNCIYMPYGDGASFSGYRADPWPVPGQNASLTFRGIRNFDATIDAALQLGLDKATDFVLTGGSAGGLSTFLHLDRVSHRLKKINAAIKTRGAPVVGFFLDHGNYQDDPWFTYTDWMKYIYGMQNLTFGGDAGGALARGCGEAFPETPHFCFMSPHMQAWIETPFYVFNSKFDLWQLENELQLTNWTTQQQQGAVLSYGSDFLASFYPVKRENGNGGFITSCICHGCPWVNLTLNGKNSFEHYADWHSGAVTGAESFTIDPRGPNGDGTLVGPSFSECRQFPTGPA